MKTGSPLPRDKRARRLRAAVLVAPLALGVGVLLACATETSLSGPGDECFAASDCQPGLVCVPLRGGARVCSNDLTQVTGRPPPEGGAADSGGDGPTEGAPGDGPVQETGMPDTSMPDTSTGMDAGADG